MRHAHCHAQPVPVSTAVPSRGGVAGWAGPGWAGWAGLGSGGVGWAGVGSAAGLGWRAAVSKQPPGSHQRMSLDLIQLLFKIVL